MVSTAPVEVVGEAIGEEKGKVVVRGQEGKFRQRVDASLMYPSRRAVPIWP
jgi:hypothetical protein